MVEDHVAALGHEEHAEVGLTGSEHAWHTVFVHQAHEMDVVGKFAARHERPAATQPEPALRGHGLSGRSCGARKQPTGIAEHPCAPPTSSKKRAQKHGNVLFQMSQDTDASAPANVSRTLNHSSGVYWGVRQCRGACDTGHSYE